MFSPDARFLVIDDSKSIRHMICSALKDIGAINIDEGGDGPTGLQKIKDAAKATRPYDLVFCDVNMPGFDGLKLLELVRADASISKTPIIMITTESSKGIVIQAVMEGISGYIVKPFRPEDIHNKVSLVFKNRA